MQIVMTGRRTTIDPQFRTYVEDRLERLDKHDPKVERVDVEVCEEANPRLADHRIRVELTWHGRGPVVRSEAAGQDFHEAFDLALGKLDRRLRKASDRRRIHHGARAPISVAAATGRHTDLDLDLEPASDLGEPDEAEDYSPMVVREKEHVSKPMTLDQALFEMELVGHEFYLFIDRDSALPSVVYRRRGYDYGVLRLHLDPADSPNGSARSGLSDA